MNLTKSSNENALFCINYLTYSIREFQRNTWIGEWHEFENNVTTTYAQKM